MTSEGLGEMFEGDSADTCAGKFPLAEIYPTGGPVSKHSYHSHGFYNRGEI